MGATAETPIWTEDGALKREAVRGMFGEIAKSYDLLNSILSFRLHYRWRAEAVRQLRLVAGAKALDVCSGTGDFLKPLLKAVGPSGYVAGVDFCRPMLEVADRKHGKRLLLGDACRLPILSSSVDGVTVGWGLRNVPDIDAAHREIARVLKPGGRFVSLDMARPKIAVMRWLSEFIFNTVTPKLGALFGKRKAYTYLPKSVQRFSTREQLADSMRSAGLTDVGYRDFLFGNVCLHWGQKP